ncbi:hypothetical protein [Variovorax sp. GT1P44]|uniref:hypothetical protein n=1 Tax=Variovorax sp. GT1P44 TaxID=3443742 RepID=UPI003F46EEB8
MNSIKAARKLLANDPTSDAAKVLARLVLTLESEADFRLADLYQLDIEHFNLALRILEEWRIDRYYAGKAKLFDVSHQVNRMSFS